MRANRMGTKRLFARNTIDRSSSLIRPLPVSLSVSAAAESLNELLNLVTSAVGRKRTVLGFQFAPTSRRNAGKSSANATMLLSGSIGSKAMTGHG